MNADDALFLARAELANALGIKPSRSGPGSWAQLMTHVATVRRESDRRADEIAELGSKVVDLHRELSDVLGEVRALLDGPALAKLEANVALRARLGGAE